MRNRIVSLVINLFLFVFTSMFIGCASIVSKSQYPVTIKSSPSGAIFTIKDKHGIEIERSTTPSTITLSASSGFFNPARYSLQFEKEGYLPVSVSLSAGMDGWYAGNLIFGGLIGILIVDPATGSMWRLDDAIFGDLSPDPNYKKTLCVKDQSPTSIKLKQLKDLKNLQKSGVLTNEEYEKKRKVLVDKL